MHSEASSGIVMSYFWYLYKHKLLVNYVEASRLYWCAQHFMVHTYDVFSVGLYDKRFNYSKKKHAHLIEPVAWYSSILQHLRCAEFSPLWRPWISWRQEMRTLSAIITTLFQWRRSGRRLRTVWAASALPRPTFLQSKLTLTGSSSTRLSWSCWCIVRSVWAFLFPGSEVFCVYAPRLVPLVS